MAAYFAHGIFMYFHSMLNSAQYSQNASSLRPPTVCTSYDFDLHIAHSSDGRKAKAKSMPMPGAAYSMSSEGRCHRDGQSSATVGAK